ncbi:MAG: sensor histidine kinase N-terminal domain-containing protein [Bacteroidia bacterium]|nr:sensor histidine kinase N-terminal domain-containing protein [Methylotenera sp.]
MLHIKTNSIRQKLLNWLLILLLPLLLLGTISAYYLANYFANLAYDRALFRVVLALADQVEVKAGNMVVDFPDSTLDLIEYDKDDYIYYQIQDPDHHVVIGEEKLTLPKVMPASGQHLYYDAKFNNQLLRLVAFSLPLAGTTSTAARGAGAKANAIILIGETRTKREKMAHDIIAIMLIPQILLIVLVTFLVNLGIKRGLISLDKLKDLIARRLPTDTHPLEEQDAPQELQPLLHAMNDLLVKEKAAVDERRHFLANAAHQLKTPLAGLKIQAEAALRENDLDSVQHALQQISTGSHNLGRLANQLLSLARAEPESNLALAFSPLDLVALMTEVTADWVPKALEKDIDLGVNCTLRKFEMSGNAVLLQELLNNLIDNSIRYNQAYAKVTVSLFIDGDEAVLAVYDDGVGIALHEQHKVFERFYRVLGTAANGCGLGLAIVREIAHQHQARVELGYADVQQLKGTVVKVIFKLNKSS